MLELYKETITDPDPEKIEAYIQSELDWYADASPAEKSYCRKDIKTKEDFEIHLRKDIGESKNIRRDFLPGCVFLYSAKTILICHKPSFVAWNTGLYATTGMMSSSAYDKIGFKGGYSVGGFAQVKEPISWECLAAYEDVSFYSGTCFTHFMQKDLESSLSDVAPPQVFEWAEAVFLKDEQRIQRKRDFINSLRRA